MPANVALHRGKYGKTKVENKVYLLSTNVHGQIYYVGVLRRTQHVSCCRIVLALDGSTAKHRTHGGRGTTVVHSLELRAQCLMSTFALTIWSATLHPDFSPRR